MKNEKKAGAKAVKKQDPENKKPKKVKKEVSDYFRVGTRRDHP